MFVHLKALLLELLMFSVSKLEMLAGKILVAVNTFTKRPWWAASSQFTITECTVVKWFFHNVNSPLHAAMPCVCTEVHTCKLMCCCFGYGLTATLSWTVVSRCEHCSCTYCRRLCQPPVAGHWSCRPLVACDWLKIFWNLLCYVSSGRPVHFILTPVVFPCKSSRTPSEHLAIDSV